MDIRTSGSGILKSIGGIQRSGRLTTIQPDAPLAYLLSTFSPVLMLSIIVGGTVSSGVRRLLLTYSSDNFESVARYADELKQAAVEALAEDAILVALTQVYLAV